MKNKKIVFICDVNLAQNCNSKSCSTGSGWRGEELQYAMRVKFNAIV